MWKTQKIRQKLNSLLDNIEATEESLPPDNSGGQVPAVVGLLFIAELIESGNFYGTCSLKIKGQRIVKPEVMHQTFRLTDIYKDYLE